ncbi:sperm protein associated with the nucleus on the X chromosome N3 isoform X1 [Piliocolobus tephrosceles]|uniref:Sperm protein associated with the nucleus on the X chromosome N3 n=1 Tax=Piliocolobus tephrosceles TaxID=591936 RepID=A0A8C9H6A6_9PRIM|nr:sperm protein associated with the nucleus on the X chromosome N3 isoform X1 [Piliocolobus tephrosceles]
MEQPTSSTSGEKMKGPCESNNNKNDEMQEAPNRVLAPEQSLKKTKTPEYPIIFVYYHKKGKKISSSQLENDQSQENSINPIQKGEDEGVDLSEGSSKQDEDLDSSEGPSKEDKDLDSSEGSSQEDEDLGLFEGSSQDSGED